MMPVAVPGSMGGGLFTGGIGYNPPVPTQRWKKELCECCADNGMCGAACCCPFITIPQLNEKYLGKPGTCQKYAIVLLIFYVAYNLFGQIVQNTPPTTIRGEINTSYFTFAGLQAACYLAYAVVATSILMTVRKLVRTKDNIPAAACGECEDCCCSFWCPCCTITQLFAQGEVKCANGYQLCSPEGIPTETGPAV